MRYEIWNKKDAIITPNGDVFTAERWISKHPAAGVDGIKIVCAAGEVKGAFFGMLGSMVDRCAANGCDFSGCETDEEKLAAIEAFEDAMNAPNLEPTAEERIAAAMEYQNALA